MQKILSCSMRFSLLSHFPAGPAVTALFHNQEFTAYADKSMQMFYGE
jgi:hypothetical protein